MKLNFSPDTRGSSARGLVRQRTGRKMQQLLTTGALTGSVGLAGLGCDPLPGPFPPMLECEAVGGPVVPASRFNQEVTWSSRGVEMYVSVELYLRPELGYYPDEVLRFSGDPAVTGAAIYQDDVASDGQTMRFLCLPEGDRVEVRAAINCNGLAHQLVLNLDVSGTPAAGAQVPVTLVFE